MPEENSCPMLIYDDLHDKHEETIRENAKLNAILGLKTSDTTSSKKGTLYTTINSTNVKNVTNLKDLLGESDNELLVPSEKVTAQIALMRETEGQTVFSVLTCRNPSNV